MPAPLPDKCIHLSIAASSFLLQRAASDRGSMKRRRSLNCSAARATATASSSGASGARRRRRRRLRSSSQPPPQQYQQQGGYYGEQQPQYDQQQPQRPPGPPPPKPPAGPILARVSSVVSGAGVGCGIGKCITGNASPRFAAAGAVSCFLSCCVGGRFGDAALALGQTTVGAVKKSRALRDGRYPVFRQFKGPGVGAAGAVAARRPVRGATSANPQSTRAFPCTRRSAALLTGGVGINFVPLPPLCRGRSALSALLFFMSLVVVRDARGDAAVSGGACRGVHPRHAGRRRSAAGLKTAQAWGLGAMRSAPSTRSGRVADDGAPVLRAASTAHAAAEAAAAQAGGPGPKATAAAPTAAAGLGAGLADDWGHPGAAGPGAGRVTRGSCYAFFVAAIVLTGRAVRGEPRSSSHVEAPPRRRRADAAGAVVT